MWCPSLAFNGSAAMLVALMMGPGGEGGPKMPMAPTITPFTLAASGKLQAGSTWAFPALVEDSDVRDSQPWGDPIAANSGHYTAAAVDEAGGMWGAGMTVDRHVNDNPLLDNWGTVVWKMA